MLLIQIVVAMVVQVVVVVDFLMGMALAVQELLGKEIMVVLALIRVLAEAELGVLALTEANQPTVLEAMAEQA